MVESSIGAIAPTTKIQAFHVNSFGNFSFSFFFDFAIVNPFFRLSEN
jgi:hypothetical protein